MRSICVLVLSVTFMAVALAGCSSGDSEPETQIGTLEGVQASFSLDEALDGEISQVDFWGVVIVALEDGTRVDAAVTNELADVLKGGDRLEVIPVEGSDYWEVIGLASDG